jgi:hypothetical protein
MNTAIAEVMETVNPFCRAVMTVDSKSDVIR